jgi:hypothetical protein
MNFEHIFAAFVALLATVCAQEVPKVSELFSFEKLAQYSSLVCIDRKFERKNGEILAKILSLFQ